MKEHRTLVHKRNEIKLNKTKYIKTSDELDKKIIPFRQHQRINHLLLTTKRIGNTISLPRIKEYQDHKMLGTRVDMKFLMRK